MHLTFMIDQTLNYVFKVEIAINYHQISVKLQATKRHIVLSLLILTHIK